MPDQVRHDGIRLLAADLIGFYFFRILNRGQPQKFKHKLVSNSEMRYFVQDQGLRKF
jgi:hypothetical protein